MQRHASAGPGAGAQILAEVGPAHAGATVGQKVTPKGTYRPYPNDARVVDQIECAIGPTEREVWSSPDGMYGAELDIFFDPASGMNDPVGNPVQAIARVNAVAGNVTALVAQERLQPGAGRVQIFGGGIGCDKYLIKTLTDRATDPGGSKPRMAFALRGAPPAQTPMLVSPGRKMQGMRHARDFTLGAGRSISVLPTQLRKLWGALMPNAGGTRFLMLFNTGAAIVNGAAPVRPPIVLGAGQDFSLTIEPEDQSAWFSAGLTWYPSTTYATLTKSTDDAQIETVFS